MRNTRLRVALSIAVAAALVATSAGAAAATGSSPALFNRTTFQYSSTLSYAQEAQRYQVMVLQSTDGAKVAQLHAANPNLKILMYSMALNSAPNDPTGLTTCTQYSTDNSSQSGWFLKDQNGHRITYDSGEMMDMGNTAYQQACIAHSVALAKKYGFNGIMFDGLNAKWTWLVSSGTTVAKYPTQAEWDAAMQSFLTNAGKALHADGLLSMANIGGTTTTLWQQWTTPLDGSMEQAWTDGGLGLAQQIPSWPHKLADVAWSEAHHKYAFLNSWNQTQSGNTYGLASMMLVAGGWSSYATNNNNNGSYEVWYPTYTDAQNLGAPTGAYTVLSNGVYERHFQNGLVLVNPTAKSVSKFSLGGTYTAYGMSATSSVSMGSTSGLIMLG